MTTKLNSLWALLSGKLKSPSGSVEVGEDLPKVGQDGLLTEPVLHPAGAESEMGSDKGSGPLSRRNKRDQAIVQLQEGYDRVTQLIEKVQDHLAAQGERTDRICSALEGLARSMSDMPNVSRQHAETLEDIVSQLETNNTRTQQLTETVGELPKVTQAQTDALTGINRQLEMAGEQNMLATQTMGKLGNAIGTLGESNTSQTEALREMNAKANQQHQALTELIAKQSKRFTMLFVVTVILAMSALASIIVGFILWGPGIQG
ncbi:MAG: hypothetical protein ACYTF1_07055 [Planctomycetota bacterium]